MSAPPPLDVAALVRADAVRVPLRDDSVDLVVTSPPYFSLRSYLDKGEHYDGQIGSEATPQAFLAALWAVTAELKRVLKPSGSMFVDLGDKYSGSGGHNNAGLSAARDRMLASGPTGARRRNAPDRYNQERGGVPKKSLMLLPERYRVGCVDQLGLLARAVIVWAKPNSLPDNADDRVWRTHEDWVHLTKEPQYFSELDHIREGHSPNAHARRKDGGDSPKNKLGVELGVRHGYLPKTERNPLGRLPGSVWTVATERLVVPEGLGVEHFAAFPTTWPKRLVLGWSPPGGVVLDPFVGTGTTVAVARALGRYGVGLDLSRDYLRLARWRVFEDERTYEKARGRKSPPKKRPVADRTVQHLF